MRPAGIAQCGLAAYRIGKERRPRRSSFSFSTQLSRPRELHCPLLSSTHKSLHNGCNLGAERGAAGVKRVAVRPADDPLCNRPLHRRQCPVGHGGRVAVRIQQHAVRRHLTFVPRIAAQDLRQLLARNPVFRTEAIRAVARHDSVRIRPADRLIVPEMNSIVLPPSDVSGSVPSNV